MSGSHPMWVRGLKLMHKWLVLMHKESHPMWVRGLKLVRKRFDTIDWRVAPHVGAWIETYKKHI